MLNDVKRQLLTYYSLSCFEYLTFSRQNMELPSFDIGVGLNTTLNGRDRAGRCNKYGWTRLGRAPLFQFHSVCTRSAANDGR